MNSPYSLDTPGEYNYKIYYDGEELASDTFEVEDDEVNTKVKVHVKLIKEISVVPIPGGDSSSDRPSGGHSASYIRPDKPSTSDRKEIKEHNAYIFGYPDGSFGPERPITRGEASMILARIISGRNDFSLTDTKYPDVTKDMWHSGAINYLADKGILTGYEDGYFRPENPITRGEFTTIIARYKSLSSSNNGKFNDVVGHWSEKFIFGVSDEGYITGYPDGSFRPNRNISRAEAVKIINEMLSRYGDKEFIISNLNSKNKFNDVDKSHWAFTHIYEASLTHRYERVNKKEEDWHSFENRK